MAPPASSAERRRWTGRRTAPCCSTSTVCLTPTAELHEQAWTAMFERVPRRARRPDHDPFTEDDYLAYVDGRPRFDGVRTFLASRGIELPEGDRDEPPGDRLGLGARQPEERRVPGPAPHARASSPIPVRSGCSTISPSLDIPVAVVSSSRNAREVLSAPVWPTASPSSPTASSPPNGGSPASRHPTSSSPPPSSSACRRSPRSSSRTRCPGSRPGRAGAFGLVIGVDRGAGRDALMKSGADLVVDDLGELVAPVRYEAPRSPRRSIAIPIDPWRLVEREYDVTRHRADRDPVRGRQRLHRDARQPRGGPRRPQPRHVPQRRSTRRGTSTTPRRRSGSPRPARRSSTSPTPS